MCNRCVHVRAAAREFRAADAEATALDPVQAFCNAPALAGRIAEKHHLPTDPKFWDNSGRDLAVRVITSLGWLGNTAEDFLLGRRLHAELTARGW